MGLFGIHDDFSEKYQSLDERFIKNKASTFFFKASGKAMAPLILPDDVLIVDRSVDRWMAGWRSSHSKENCFANEYFASKTA